MKCSYLKGETIDEEKRIIDAAYYDDVNDDAS